MAVIYVDESKDPAYIIAALVIQDPQIPKIRKILLASRRKNQRSIHFKKESPNRRKELIDLYVSHKLELVLFLSGKKNAKAAREACFEELVKYSKEMNIGRIVIERDDSVFEADEKLLVKLISEAGCKGSIGFEHFYRHEEPLLWVPDSIAWCANRGGEWSRLARPLIKGH